METILLLDDEPQILESQRTLLEVSGYTSVRTAKNGEEARRIAEAEPIALLILDLSLGDESGIDTLRWFRENSPDTLVLVVTGASDIRIAVECMRLGAYDFLIKSADTARIPSAVRNALDHRAALQENLLLRDAFVRDRPQYPEAFADFVTVSEAVNRVFSYLEAVSGLSDPVLITGETGVGKEIVANALHKASGRSGPFVAVNVGGLDEHAVTDTLFGHVPGAFTGATSSREGMIRQAANGTLFLDEFSDMSLDAQVKLLRFLDSGEFLPLGTDRVHHSRARLVFATNRDLESVVAEGGFRRDLYYRVSAHHVRIPPLRERPDDIVPIFRHLLNIHAKRLSRPHPALPPGYFARLRRLHLEGNVRELQQVVIQGLITGEWALSDRDRTAGATDTLSISFGDALPTPAEAVEALLQEADRRFPNNRTAAAAAVGLSPQAFANRRRRMFGDAE